MASDSGTRDATQRVAKRIERQQTGSGRLPSPREAEKKAKAVALNTENRKNRR